MPTERWRAAGAAGQKPRYKTAAEMQTAIDALFKSCMGEALTDPGGGPVYDKYGRPIMVGPERLH